MQTQKTVKFSLLFTLILAFVAITVVAIGGVMKKEKSVGEERGINKEANTVWFYFNSPIDPSDPDYEDALLDETNYSSTNDTEAPEDCEPGPDKVCAVRAEPSTSNPDHPNPTDLIALLEEMTSANPDEDLVILKLFEPQ